MNRCSVAQHQAVAAERDDDVGRLRPGVAVAADQPAAGLLRRRRVAGDEGDPLERVQFGALP